MTRILGKMGAAATVAVALVGLLESGRGLAAEIEWRSDLAGAFQESVKTGKPLVVYFHRDYCPQCKGRCQACKKLEEECLKSKEMQAYAGRAIFVWQDFDKDDAKKNVSTLIRSLNIKRLPTVTVLRCRTKQIEEVGRVIGCVPHELFCRQFGTLMDKAAPRTGADNFLLLPAPPAIPPA